MTKGNDPGNEESLPILNRVKAKGNVASPVARWTFSLEYRGSADFVRSAVQPNQNNLGIQAKTESYGFSD